jgi:putative transposase
MKRQGWIDKEDKVPVSRQCDLAGVSRATIYAHFNPRQIDESDLPTASE